MSTHYPGELKGGATDMVNVTNSLAPMDLMHSTGLNSGMKVGDTIDDGSKKIRRIVKEVVSKQIHRE